MARCAEPSIVRAIRIATTVLCVPAIIAMTGGAVRGQGATATAPAQVGATFPTAAGTAVEIRTPDVGGCEAAVRKLGAGDLSGVRALPDTEVNALTHNVATVPAFACMAIAEGDTKYCDPLPQASRDACLEQARTLGALKKVPKDSVKAEIMEKLCLRDASAADCEVVRKALAARDPALCAQIPSGEGPWGRTGLCPALASGDPAKCAGAPTGGPRENCEALATGDAARCAKDSADCTRMVGDLAKMQKGGMEAKGIDPLIAAAHQGKNACAPLIQQLKAACGTLVTPGGGGASK